MGAENNRWEGHRWTPPNAIKTLPMSPEAERDYIDACLERATALLAEAAEVVRKYPDGEKADPICCDQCAWYVERAQPALKLIEEFLN